MEFAGKMKQVHMHYCSLYPKFVSTIDKHKELVTDLLKNKTIIPNCPDPVVAQLNRSLSDIFRRLDKYPALLQELQRFTSESDPDRGDTQRAGFLFRELVSCCLDVRRRKDMELEVMSDGGIKNLPDNFPPIESFGDIIRMGPVVVTQTPEEVNVFLKDRYLILFPSDLLILSISRDMTSFTFDARLALTDVTLPRVSPAAGDADKRDIDLLLAGGKKYTLRCPSPEDFLSWMSLMLEAKRSCDSIYVRYSVSAAQSSLNPFISPTTKNNESSVSRQSSSISSGSSHRPIRASTSPRPSPQVTSRRRTSGYWADKSLLPHGVTTYIDILSANIITNKKSAATNKRQVREKRATSPADDFAMFQTIESYCTNTAMTGTAPRTPRKVNTLHPEKPNNERSIPSPSPSTHHNRSREDDSTSPQTIKFLMDEIQTLRKEMFNMRKDMESLSDSLRKETEARMKLERNLASFT